MLQQLWSLPCSGAVLIFLCWGFVVLPYRVPALDYIGYSVYTNNPVRAPQRGHGAPQIRFAIESQLDMIAEELGIDPIEIRLKNARRKGEMLPNGDPIRNAGLVECIEEAAKRTDFLRKYWENTTQQKENKHIKSGVGIGVSSYFTVPLSTRIILQQ
jgi:CO/xanthine dehydrogenase Mo-binding subunit